MEDPLEERSHSIATTLAQRPSADLGNRPIGSRSGVEDGVYEWSGWNVCRKDRLGVFHAASTVAFQHDYRWGVCLLSNPPFALSEIS